MIYLAVKKSLGLGFEIGFPHSCIQFMIIGHFLYWHHSTYRVKEMRMQRPDAPLVLWDCIFPENDDSTEDAMDWVYVGETGGRETNKRPEIDGGDSKFGKGGIMDSVWEVWHKRKLDEILAGSLMDIVAAQGKRSPSDVKMPPPGERSIRIFDGGDWPKPVGTYVPISKKQRMEPVEVVNARYLERKGPYKPKKLRMEDNDE